MVTIKTSESQFIAGFDVRCLSTDTKPTQNIPNGSVLIEIDTAKGYLFDAESGVWHEVPAGSAVVINPATGVSF